MQNTLITIIGTWAESHSKNWIECESTWVPKLRELGFEVLILMSNPYLDKEYEKIGNFFFSKCSDNPDEIYLKSQYFISKYVLTKTNYEYRFQLDSDSFVHPDRFIKFIKDYTINTPKDYVGCAIPYPGFHWDNLIQKEIDDNNIWASGGSGFLLSRKSMKCIVNGFKRNEWEDLYIEDYIVGKILYKNNIKLFHDSRLLFSSPYKQIINNPGNDPINFIGNKDSFLAVQHYCHGHMQEIIDKLEL